MRSSAAIDLRPWPNDPSVCHLILRDHVTVPAGTDVDRWVERVIERSDDPTETIRPSAHFPEFKQVIDRVVADIAAVGRSELPLAAE